MIVIGVGAIIVGAMLTGFYGNHLGFPFFPLFIAAVFLGFPLVLLAVTVAGARRQQQAASQDAWAARALEHHRA